jgi:hypothetical protein
VKFCERCKIDVDGQFCPKCKALAVVKEDIEKNNQDEYGGNTGIDYSGQICSKCGKGTLDNPNGIVQMCSKCGAKFSNKKPKETASECETPPKCEETIVDNQDKMCPRCKKGILAAYTSKKGRGHICSYCLVEYPNNESKFRKKTKKPKLHKKASHKKARKRRLKMEKMRTEDAAERKQSWLFKTTAYRQGKIKKRHDE